MAALFAELERGMIGERTKAGMAQKGLEGSHLGRQAHRPGSSNRDLVANWPGWSLDQKRHALRSAIDRIVVTQGRLPIDQRLEITPRI